MTSGADNELSWLHAVDGSHSRSGAGGAMMTTAADRYRQIAEERRVFADDAKSRNWIEVYRILNERASLNEHMAETMSRYEFRLRGLGPEEPTR
jgi:hypothetical protein